ncbi:MAG TPA: methylated-DNA--[protein]-cysteine S-methyltransferase [Actinomycetota bacterium]|nr:methylated-DNA--[protein]-cysteine S-methyltransferase [Actinomycetota bacterium]
MNVQRDLKKLSPGSDAARDSRAAAQDLARRAAAEGLVDVAVATMDSPIGELMVAVTPRGLVTVAFEGEDRDVLFERLARELSPRVMEATAPTDEARRELEQYFGGDRRRFEITVDRSLIGPFAQKVLQATSEVGYGELATYGDIAGRIDRPKAARAVGSALGSNPIPIVIPCHRIVGAGGKLTGYAGGLPRKETLLRLEGSLLER